MIELSSEYDDEKKGDALYAMEFALSLEKLRKEKLLHLHKVADENNDVQLTWFVRNKLLSKQVETIEKISEYVTQLRRVGKGHGVWRFDQMVLHEGEGVECGTLISCCTRECENKRLSSGAGRLRDVNGGGS